MESIAKSAEACESAPDVDNRISDVSWPTCFIPCNEHIRRLNRLVFGMDTACNYTLLAPPLNWLEAERNDMILGLMRHWLALTHDALLHEKMQRAADNSVHLT